MVLTPVGGAVVDCSRPSPSSDPVVVVCGPGAAGDRGFDVGVAAMKGERRNELGSMRGVQFGPVGVRLREERRVTERRSWEDEGERFVGRGWGCLARESLQGEGFGC
ncbi:hypothetical protein H0E87_021048 [Populus deltoides]|uniref:Uncharacterized protein n=1 Tax=Populus deltoides TaxID=3696 RepID=A0A8T2XR99_POPDE|nr:hypothetical protein H0E87_021048 [Populus deltoides]